ERNLPFQPSVGIHTSKRMSESLVGRIDPATRQAVVTIAGLKVPAGTTVAVVIVVSGRPRLAKLSQDVGAAKPCTQIRLLAESAKAPMALRLISMFPLQGRARWTLDDCMSAGTSLLSSGRQRRAASVVIPCVGHYDAILW